MQVLTLLLMTSQTISVRWPQTTIQKSLTYWTTINIQVLYIFEAMDLCVVIFLLDVLMGPIFVISSLLTAHIATDTDERKKFVQTYLSSSGNLMSIDLLYQPLVYLATSF